MGCALQKLALGLLRTPALLCVNSRCSQPLSCMALVLLSAGECLVYSPCLFWGSKSVPPSPPLCPGPLGGTPPSRGGEEGSWSERTKGPAQGRSPPSPAG